MARVGINAASCHPSRSPPRPVWLDLGVQGAVSGPEYYNKLPRQKWACMLLCVRWPIANLQQRCRGPPWADRRDHRPSQSCDLAGWCGVGGAGCIQPPAPSSNQITRMSLQVLVVDAGPRITRESATLVLDAGASRAVHVQQRVRLMRAQGSYLIIRVRDMFFCWASTGRVGREAGPQSEVTLSLFPGLAKSGHYSRRRNMASSRSKSEARFKHCPTWKRKHHNYQSTDTEHFRCICW